MKTIIKRLTLLLIVMLLFLLLTYTPVTDVKLETSYAAKIMIMNKDVKQQKLTKNTNNAIRKWKSQFYKQTNQNKDMLYSSIPHKFKPLVNSDQYELMLEIWDKFTEVCLQNNITYILYQGTLLGSYRHHGMIPWDDDIDVLMKMDDIRRLQRIVVKLKEFDIYKDRRTYKFFKVHGQFMIHHPGFNWPFVDIFFYKENETHLWDEGWRPEFIAWEKARYFPLKYRPYEDGLHPVPNDIVYGLEQEGKYDIDNVCKSHNFDHKLHIEHDVSVIETILCKTLYAYYPFVHRTYENYRTLERLIINDTELK